MQDSRRTYLDDASESPLLPAARDSMHKWIGRAGDPSRVYSEATAARIAVEEAREAVATLAGATQRAVTFTSSATEALNWAVMSGGRRIVAGATEHSAVLDPARRRADTGSALFELVSVDKHGAIEIDALCEVLASGEKATVFVQHANHEIGTIQPVEAAAEVCRQAGATLVVDAAQTFGRIPVSLESTGADILVVSAHKFGGPAGGAALITARGTRIEPMLLGGSQERARRAGPENVAAIAGFGAAAGMVATDLVEESGRERKISDHLRSSITSKIHGVVFLGDPEARLPHIVSLQLPGVQGEPVVLGLDRVGYAVHSGSACSSEILEPSHILEAIGAEGRENLRVSVGRSTPLECVEPFVKALAGVVAGLQALGGARDTR